MESCKTVIVRGMQTHNWTTITSVTNAWSQHAVHLLCIILFSFWSWQVAHVKNLRDAEDPRVLAWDRLASRFQNMLYQLPASSVESGSGTLSRSGRKGTLHAEVPEEDHLFLHLH